DKETAHKKDAVMSRFAELIYNGFWFSKERLKLQKIIDQKRSRVQGTVKLKIYKGNVSILSRISNKSIYSMKNVSFEENKTFNKRRVENFIKKNARLLRK
ncbi:MAG: argininosuccinate synthase, partial [Alphaproteobacteria bacterium]|nr:argininosuccinate synthase [Alphaproteobacteria bacterium]